MYAIIEAKGQQFKIGQGDMIKTEKMTVEVGDTVTLDRVLLLAKDDGDVLIGNPVVSGASAVAKVVEHGRRKKIIVFRYKAKSNYRRKTGHRQDYTKLLIEEIKSE